MLSSPHSFISLSFTSFVKFSTATGQVLLGKCFVNSHLSSDQVAVRHRGATNSGLTKLCLLEQFNVKAARLFLCSLPLPVISLDKGRCWWGKRSTSQSPNRALREDFPSSTINATQTVDKGVEFVAVQDEVSITLP